MNDDDSLTTDGGDEPASEYDATARGIIQCLRMLAEEAASLGMPETLAALYSALETCRTESDVTVQDPAQVPMGAPPGAMLH